MVLNNRTATQNTLLPMPGDDWRSWANQLVSVLQPIMDKVVNAYLQQIYDAQGNVVFGGSGLADGAVSVRRAAYDDDALEVVDSWTQLLSVTLPSVQGDVLIVAKAFKESGGDAQIRVKRGATVLDYHDTSASAEQGTLTTMDSAASGETTYVLEAIATNSVVLRAKSLLAWEVRK